MASVEIYTTQTCPYCFAAKRLLARKGVAFKEMDVSRDPALRQAMTQRAGGRRTVPQIFINGRHVGGSDDLHDLDDAGKLDPFWPADARSPSAAERLRRPVGKSAGNAWLSAPGR
ncbi:MAG: glutaredoxin 3, partial [Tabrizicola sp.]|nr:glutaredoxin 3 [Tabrizicola sp.]